MRTYQNFSEAWWTELNSTMFEGTRSSPRTMGTLERQWVEFRVVDPMTFPVQAGDRDWKHAIGIIEGLQLVGQFALPEQFTSRFGKFDDFTDGGVFHGSYGGRVSTLLDDLVRLLERDPDTRQAVLTIYDSHRDLNRIKRDLPCTIAVQFLRDMNRRLGMRVTMRSNDLWLGTPYDFTQFAMLQASVAQALGWHVGEYVHSVGSLHLYDRDNEKAQGISQPDERTFDLPLEFPLWNPDIIDREYGEPATASQKMERISRRARELSWGLVISETEFEHWVMETL